MKKNYLIIFLFISMNVYSQTDSVYYHNYSFESQYGASGAYPSTDYMQMITRFTPPVYPAQLMGVRVWFRNATSPAPFKIIVREDSMATADANNSTLLYMSPSAIVNPASNGLLDSAYSEYVDLSSMNFNFNSGDVYAGVTQNLQINGFIGLALDTNYQSLNDRQWISTSQGSTGSWWQFINWSFIPSQYGITAYFRSLQNEVQNIPSEKTFSISPNPVSDFFSINIPDSKNISLRIFDLEGKLQKEFSNINLSHAFKVADLDEGVYIVELKNNSSHSFSKFIKE